MFGLHLSVIFLCAYVACELVAVHANVIYRSAKITVLSDKSELLLPTRRLLPLETTSENRLFLTKLNVMIYHLSTEFYCDEIMGSPSPNLKQHGLVHFLNKLNCIKLLSRWEY